MITINKVSFRYSRTSDVFDELSLGLSPGHIYGLLGKNGAGKTTLLKLICGLAFPKKGMLMVDDFIPGKRNPEMLSQMMFVPEDLYIPPLRPSGLSGMYSRFYRDFDPVLYREYIDKFEVDFRQPLSGVSSGQKKKAMLAFALACNTRYILLDEPTNGLDIPSKATFRSLLSSVFSEDRIILISTHQVRDLQSLIDSVIVLHDKHIVLDQSLDSVSLKLEFRHSVGVPDPSLLIYSCPAEMGEAHVLKNPSGVPGKVNIETLFNACINEQQKIQSVFNN